MNKFAALIGLLLCFPLSIQAQTQIFENRNCASQDVLEKQNANSPEILKLRELINVRTQEITQRPSVTSLRSAINIPVVVHLVYNAAAENLTDAQIQSQIDVLNEDFNKQSKELATSTSIYKNSAANVGITFCLASVDPKGKFTKGIERKQSTRSTWGTSDIVKFSSLGGLDAWESKNYLNVWICNIGGGSIGYSQFPGGSPNSDGIVIDYRFFGRIGSLKPFDKGRTLTHEIGHWLNLIHIWGDSQCGDDRVDDTPTHHNANYGCPSVPFVSNSCGSAITEMTMNFMDYVNDACMYLFTEGQKARMLALFEPNMPRHDILNSLGCSFVVQPVVNCTAAKNFTVSTITENAASFDWKIDSTTTQQKLIITDNAQSSQQIIDLGIGANSFIPINLKSQTKYAAYISSVCKTGEILNSDVLIFTTFAPPPKIICVSAKNTTITNFTENSANMNWLVNTTTTDQQIVFFEENKSSQTLIPLDGNANSYSLQNLKSQTTYHVFISSTCKSSLVLNSDEIVFTTLAPPVIRCSDAYENNNSRAQSKQISSNATINAVISDATDRDWFYFKTQAGTHYTIKLSNLPADYDLKIFNAQGKFISSSENDGTWDENISYNALKSDSIFIVVYGYNGNSDSTNCYSLGIKSSFEASLFSNSVSNLSTNQNLKRAYQHSSANTFSLYPNPTSGILNIVTPQTDSDYDSAINLFDATGKIVLSKSVKMGVTKNSAELSVSDLPSGLYLLQINNESAQNIFKVMIAH